jgi:hypothetical protein
VMHRRCVGVNGLCHRGDFGRGSACAHPGKNHESAKTREGHEG